MLLSYYLKGLFDGWRVWLGGWFICQLMTASVAQWSGVHLKSSIPGIKSHCPHEICFKVELYLHLHLSCSLADYCGTTVDSTTNFLHSSPFSAFSSMMFHSRPVHSLILSSNRFLCLHLRLPPCSVLCRILLAGPDNRMTWLYHFSLHLFTEVRRSSYGLMAFPILVFTSSLVLWSQCEIRRSSLNYTIDFERGTLLAAQLGFWQCRVSTGTG